MDLKLIFILSPMLSSTVMFSYWIRLYLLKRAKGKIEKTEVQKIFKQTLLLFSIAIPSDLWNTHYLYGTNDLENAHPEVRTLELIDSVALYSCITNLTWIGRKVCPYLWKDQESLLRPTPENFKERLEFCFKDSDWRKKDRVCESAVNGGLKKENKALRIKYFTKVLNEAEPNDCGNTSAGSIESLAQKLDLLDVGGPILEKQCFSLKCPNSCSTTLTDYLTSLKIPYIQRAEGINNKDVISIALSLARCSSLGDKKTIKCFKGYRRLITYNYSNKDLRENLRAGVKVFFEKHSPKHLSIVDFTIFN